MFKQLKQRLPPAVIALFLQLAACLLLVILLRVTQTALHPLVFSLLCGFMAAALSYIAGLARWWLFIQILFAPALVLMLKLNIPSGVYLTAFVFMVLVYWSTFRSQVPLFLSSKKVWRTLEELLPPAQENKRFRFMDIGSGLGGVLTHLADARPDGLYFGIENAPLPYYLSWLRIKLGNHDNCHILWHDLWSCDLAPYDVVYAYLSPVPMENLWHKLKKEMRPGTLFISNSFPFKRHPAQYSITLDDMQRSTLYIWHM
ncbi:MAG: class I SAM-dependent methyltransferase [Gallionellaceae bacterium]